MLFAFLLYSAVLVQAQAPGKTLSGSELNKLSRSVNPERLPDLFDMIAYSKNAGDQEIDALISYLSDERRAVKGILVSADKTVSRYAADALVNMGEISVLKLRSLLTEGESASADLQSDVLMILGSIGIRSWNTGN